MKKRFSLSHLFFALPMLAALTLSACGSGATGGGGQATQPPVTAPTQATTPPTAPPVTGAGSATLSKNILLDPANAIDADSLSVIGYLYEGLFRVESDQVQPVLAESYTVANDGLDYIITLRTGVSFHDGTPMNADAVIANFYRWFDSENPAHKSGDFTAWASIFGGFKGETDANGEPKSEFDGAEKVDERTVLIHLTRPDNLFIAKLNNPAFFIVSPAAFNADYFGTMLGKVAGTGPYMVSGWTDTALTLAPNPSYWGTPAATNTMEFQLK